MYSPDLGRFLQTDPIGYADGINWYAYCGNNPVNWIDPWGLSLDGGFSNMMHGMGIDQTYVNQTMMKTLGPTPEQIRQNARSINMKTQANVALVQTVVGGFANLIPAEGYLNGGALVCSGIAQVIGGSLEAIETGGASLSAPGATLTLLSSGITSFGLGAGLIMKTAIDNDSTVTNLPSGRDQVMIDLLMDGIKNNGLLPLNNTDESIEDLSIHKK
jgi:hypothetical protein